MCEMVIEKAMVIDDVECVKTSLEKLTGKKIQDMQVVKKFICSEKYTKFYIDKRMKSSVNHDTDNIYVWLDTGFCDMRNNPIFISLLNEGYRYAGHHIGTARDLVGNIRNYYPKHMKEINTNFSRFLSKYNQKCEQRDNQHIEDENTYCLCKVNEDFEETNEMARKISRLNVSWEADLAQVEEVEENAPAEEDALSKEEKEITIGLLLEMLEEREQYIQELLDNLENSKMKSNTEIQELVEVIKEQSVVIKERTDALNRIRIFNDEEAAEQIKRDMNKEEKQKALFGHNLLESHKKIIIIGDAKISLEVMKGIITKEYGFEESDFEYELDYNKVVHSSGRILDSSKYQAIIFGCCPHSAMGKGKWSSLIEKCKQSAEGTFVVDARNVAGNLKVTKGSFRKAVGMICDKLMDVA